MKYADINKRYTDTISDWLSKGYTINSATMSGSQGEIAKIDLTDGHEVIRILLDRFKSYERKEDEHYDLDGVELIIGRSTDEAAPNDADNWTTIWSSHLEVISCERFYELGQRKRWYGTKDDSIAQQNKHHSRYRTRYITDCRELPESAKVIVLPFIKRQAKCKSTRLSDISRVIRLRTHYIVEVKGKRYTLH